MQAKRRVDARAVVRRGGGDDAIDHAVGEGDGVGDGAGQGGIELFRGIEDEATRGVAVAGKVVAAQDSEGRDVRGMAALQGGGQERGEGAVVAFRSRSA